MTCSDQTVAAGVNHECVSFQSVGRDICAKPQINKRLNDDEMMMQCHALFKHG